MTDEELELSILEKYVVRHQQAETADPRATDKCARELDMREVLRELTGESFGYGPPTAAGIMGGSGLAGATADQRVRAIRRWFGWWIHNKKTWAGRKASTDEEEDG